MNPLQPQLVVALGDILGNSGVATAFAAGVDHFVAALSAINMKNSACPPSQKAKQRFAQGTPPTAWQLLSEGINRQRPNHCKNPQKAFCLSKRLPAEELRVGVYILDGSWVSYGYRKQGDLIERAEYSSLCTRKAVSTVCNKPSVFTKIKSKGPFSPLKTVLGMWCF